MPLSPSTLALLAQRGIIPQSAAPMDLDAEQETPQIVAPTMRPGQVTPTAALDFGNKLAQSGLVLPGQGAAPPPPDPAAGFKKATAAIGIPAAPEQAATRWQPTGQAAKPPPPPPVFAQPEQAPATAAARSTMLLPSGGGGGGVRPAQDISTIGPNERAELDAARGEVRGAYDELVGTPTRSTMSGVVPSYSGGLAGENEAKADASKYLSAMSGVEAARAQQAESHRTRAMLDQEAEQQKLRDDAANSPLKYDRRSFGARAAGAVFMALNAFGNAIQRAPGAPNLAKEIIDQSIERDYQDQLAVKKGKEEKAAAGENLLARMRQRFGDDRAAEAGFRAMRWQEYAAEAEAMATRAKSPILLAQAKLLRGQADVETAELNVKTHQFIPAGAIGGGKSPAEEYRDYAKRWLNGDQKIPLQDFGEWQRSMGGVGHGPTAPEGGAASSQQKTADQLRAYDNVLDKAREVEAMVKRGGQLSPSETARGKALVSELVNEIPRAQLGTTRAPAEKEQELVKMGLPKDPNSFQFTGSDLAKIQQTIRSLEAEKARLGGGSGAPPASAAQLGATPLGSK